MALSPKEIHELKYFATEIRLNTLETLNHLGFGHYGGSLSVVEILAVLYGKVMDMTPVAMSSHSSRSSIPKKTSSFLYLI